MLQGHRNRARSGARIGVRRPGRVWHRRPACRCRCCSGGRDDCDFLAGAGRDARSTCPQSGRTGCAACPYHSCARAQRSIERNRPRAPLRERSSIRQAARCRGAEVTLTDTAGRKAVAIHTDASGQFVVRDLPPGDYELVVLARVRDGHQSSEARCWRECARLADDAAGDALGDDHGRLRGTVGDETNALPQQRDLPDGCRTGTTDTGRRRPGAEEAQRHQAGLPVSPCGRHHRSPDGRIDVQGATFNIVPVLAATGAEPPQESSSTPRSPPSVNGSSPRRCSTARPWRSPSPFRSLSSGAKIYAVTVSSSRMGRGVWRPG